MFSLTDCTGHMNQKYFHVKEGGAFAHISNMSSVSPRNFFSSGAVRCRRLLPSRGGRGGVRFGELHLRENFFLNNPFNHEFEKCKYIFHTH